MLSKVVISPASAGLGIERYLCKLVYLLELQRTALDAEYILASDLTSSRDSASLPVGS
jgi:hypothetical protein